MYPYFDAHCDTVSVLHKKGGSLYRNSLHVDLAGLSAYSPAAQVFALFTDIGSKMRSSCRSEEEFLKRVRAGEVTVDDSASTRYRSMRDKFYALARENSEHMTFCRSAVEIDLAAARGKTAAILAVEGAEQLFASSIDEFYEDGVRVLTLTWNYPNAYGGSCVTGGGLTVEGRELVRRANELGILLDLSHGSDELFYDVLAVSEKPVAATHSNSRAVRPHRRNLTDEQFALLTKKGGAVGINLFADFLTDGECRISDVCRHIERFMSLGGERSVALGGDLDGCSRLPEGIAGVGDVYKIADELARLGYADGLIYDIFYGNFRRVLAAAIG